jgi:hypothetical protein
VSPRLPSPRALAAVLVLAVPDSPAHAVLDIEDRGPVLAVGDARLRVTNAGILGNAFFDAGLSFDPSFEYPQHSGAECLNYAALWVGGRLPSGEVRVSGGPHLEWRPTLDPDDRVRTAVRGELGRLRLWDDDGDGAIDEERLDDRDDDGDGRIDEDLGLEGDQVMTATYTDFERAAILGVYPSGERHEPLGLAVRQTVIGWRAPGLEGAVGLRFEITNVGGEPIDDVWIGLYADLDSRRRSDRAGHLDDRVSPGSASFSRFTGVSTITALERAFSFPCFESAGAGYVVLIDGREDSGLPSVAVVPLDHTVDPLAGAALGSVARSFAVAPGAVRTNTSVFLAPGSAVVGSAPRLERERYDALRGALPQAPLDRPGDYQVLVSFGPFRFRGGNQTVHADFALVAGAHPDSVRVVAARVLELHRGVMVNLLPDSLPASQANQYTSGATGTFGHEVCVEPPEGVEFVADPDCSETFVISELDGPPPAFPRTYRPGTCVWTNADCNRCTGIHGNETRAHWFDAGTAAPAPGQRARPFDHAVRIEWDNLPEVLVASGQLGPVVGRVVGYRLYKLVDWRGRVGELPSSNRWALLAAYATEPADTALGQIPLVRVVDPGVEPLEVLHERTRYPVGRYAHVDPDVHNGFDYVYRVTTVVELIVPQQNANARITRLETPVVARFEDIVAPQAAARENATKVWVVPNPFRGAAHWDRPNVPGDPTGRHIDFMGLPRARCTIKIWTVAGDFVSQIDHDGTNGDGQASWNLVSRNGQDVESGIYLFTVRSPLGESIGRFVVVR